MSVATLGAAIWDILKRIPGWVFFALGALVLGKIYLDRERSKAVANARTKWEGDAAKVESEVITQITENSNALVRESDAVRSRPAVVELPDGTKTLPDYHFRD